jgi:hypothetical protein
MTETSAPAGFGRRSFLGLCAAAGLAPAMGSALWQQAEAQATPGAAPQPAGPVTVAMVAAAEVVAGLAFTDAEREMLVQDLNAGLRSLADLRTIPLPNEVAPALLFRPLESGLPPEGTAPAQPRGRVVAAPAGESDLAFRSVAELSELVRTRQVTSERLTRLALDRLRAMTPSCSAW